MTDAEQSSVFKLDSNLNFVKKFGQKELKWPRGIICDSDFPYFRLYFGIKVLNININPNNII